MRKTTHSDLDTLSDLTRAERARKRHDFRAARRTTRAETHELVKLVRPALRKRWDPERPPDGLD